MATLFVRKTGSDANSGLSAVLAKLTLAGAFSAAANNDTIYVGAGTYRETNTTARTGISLIGDVDGVQTGDVGEVIISAYTTNDKTIPAVADTLNVGKDWTIKKLTIVGGGGFTTASNYALRMNQAASVTSALVQDCFIKGFADNEAIRVDSSFVAMNLTVERCRLQAVAEVMTVGLATAAAGSDIDANVTIRNNVIMSSAGGAGGVIFVLPASFNAKRMGGVRIYNNFLWCGAGPIVTTNSLSFTSTTIPIKVLNNHIIFISDPAGVYYGFDVGAAGQLVEDFNVFDGNLTTSGHVYNNVTAGANTIGLDGSVCALFSLGQEAALGFHPRTAFTPYITSPVLAYGSDASVTLTEDITGRQRPAGASSATKAVGPHERHDTWKRETTTTHTGPNAVSITGPGDQDFEVPVDAVSTTLKVFMQKDSTYAGTAPQFKVVNGSEAGVADATATMTVAANTWEELTLTFTPTSQGIVTVRLQSNDTAGTGKAFADTRTGW